MYNPKITVSQLPFGLFMNNMYLYYIYVDDSMHTMGIVHRNSKLVAGCGNGKLYMYHWKQFGYHSAEFPGHPAPINSLVAVTDNVIITACDDGAIR